MIEYLIGVDGGGTGTRVRVARADGVEVAQASSGPSGLSHGIGKAWAAVNDAAAKAFASIGIDQIPFASSAIGLGLAGVHNKEWASQFVAANPGYAEIALDNDGVTTLMGAHAGQPGVIVAIGTGSVGESLLADGTQREVGGWGFPAGDEASGAWMGLRSVTYIQQVIDGRRAGGAFANAVIDACGGSRDAIQVWLGQATQTTYASLARLVVGHAQTDEVARSIMIDAGREVASIAKALDPSEQLPLALCGGLGEVLRAYLPAELLSRVTAAKGDSANGALRLIEQHLKKKAQQ
jgi:glucosamine kinase